MAECLKGCLKVGWRPMRRNLRQDHDAVAGVLAFGIAGVVFVASVGALLLASRHAGTPATNDLQSSAVLNGQARSLADLVLGSPGFGASGGGWQPANNIGAGSPSADNLKRLGLVDETNPGVLSFAKLQNLRRAPYVANPTDGYVNYPEARTDLGLAASNLDFHIRAYPSLSTVSKILNGGHPDPNLKVTYIGDIDVSRTQGQPPPSNPAANLTVGTPTCAVSPLRAAPNPQGYRLAVAVTNGGSVATQFTALFTYTLNGTTTETQNANTYLVARGETASLFVDVPAYAQVTGNGNNQVTRQRSCAVGSTISAAVSSGSAHVTSSTTVAVAVTNAKTGARDFWLDTSKPYYLDPASGTGCAATEQVKLAYDGLNLVSGDKLSFRVLRQSDGTQAWPAGGTPYNVVAPSKSRDRFVTVGCLAPGTYRATMDYYTGAQPTGNDAEVVEQVLVLDSATYPTGPAAYTPPSLAPPTGPNVYTSKPPAYAEIYFLDKLIEQFCPTYFDSTATAANYAVDWTSRCSPFKGGQVQPGDVFPDSKDVMNNDLPARLLFADGTPRFDITNVLVAGTNVDQTAMSSAAAKDAVRDWVLGGGTLLVFGSGDQNVNWLEPIFHAAIRSSSGGIGVPDPGHPVLHVADELDYPFYSNHGQTWGFTGQTALDAATLFTNVVVQGTEPVTTVSNPGAMGDGNVILTTWRPSDVYNGGRDASATSLEGLRLTNNLLMQGYRDLYLDYGPPLPSLTNVIPAVRVTQVTHPRFVDPVQLSVIVFVF